ncbi:MAG: DNRLRE domain-containing protein [Phycisphaerales bacterium]|jgi:hypothetical protein|nr:DNRLRE domain-containing protein [Phycisphaerales bacterium]
MNRLAVVSVAVLGIGGWGSVHAAQIVQQLSTSNAIDAPINSSPAYNSSSYYNYIGMAESTLVTNVLYRFDLPAIPGGSTINSATFSIWKFDDGNITQTADVHAITKDWTNSVTYSTYDGTNPWSSSGMGSGTDYEAAVTATVAFNAPGWHDIDITSQYQQWFSGAEANYGLVLIPTTLDNQYTRLAATEPVPPNTEPFGLQLTVDYTPVPEPTSLGLLCVAGLLGLRRRRKA